MVDGGGLSAGVFRGSVAGGWLGAAGGSVAALTAGSAGEVGASGAGRGVEQAASASTNKGRSIRSNGWLIRDDSLKSGLRYAGIADDRIEKYSKPPLMWILALEALVALSLLLLIVWLTMGSSRRRDSDERRRNESRGSDGSDEPR